MIVLEIVNKTIAESIVSTEKEKRITKWYNAISNIFDENTISNYKTELKESLVSRSYTEKINNISVTNDVELPKIPNLDDIHIAEELYCRGRLSSTKLTALKRTFNI